MLPEKVKIGSVDYTVTEAAHRNAESNETLCGEIDYFQAVIYINETGTKQTKEQTLLHEIVHGILITMGKGELNEDEAFVDGLSYNLHQLLTDNHLYFGKA